MTFSNSLHFELCFKALISGFYCNLVARTAIQEYCGNVDLYVNDILYDRYAEVFVKTHMNYILTSFVNGTWKLTDTPISLYPMFTKEKRFYLLENTSGIRLTGTTVKYNDVLAYMQTINLLFSNKNSIWYPDGIHKGII